ncbi:MoaF N-terminal domain-containing protein [uncultured Acetobacteroides sp.]|uniref:MoaF N-terminal domain-containing protein n=1 Tax=uncultured Acetobacteroides sp. TaxID=1760811 RepID=UPI0029F55AC1|nr:MoaF N-terminal domain-containing protein [uncultured Acetobacteroides sp.]
MKFLNLLIGVVLVGTISCQQQRSTKDAVKEVTTSDIFSDSTRIIGKRLRLTYPEYTVFESFKSDSTIAWTSVNIDGERDEGFEDMSYFLVEDNIHFVEWVTKEGEVISQVLDTKGMKVYTIVNHLDRGKKPVKQKKEALSGTIKYLK